jgi:arylsulfatase
MGFSDIGCYGSEIQTPNIDRLATQGIRFTQFYNNAKCTTTRASLLSGMYPRNNGNNIPLEIPTVAETMRAAGYQTGMSGKWHLGNKPPQRPFDRGFDEYYGLMDGAVNFFNPAQPDPDFKGGKVRDLRPQRQTRDRVPARLLHDRRLRRARDRNDQAFAKEQKPFFIHLAFNSPHYPLHAWPEDIAKYAANTGRLGRTSRAASRPPDRDGHRRSRWPLPPPTRNPTTGRPANQDWEDLRMATYAAMVDRMDQNIGKVLQTLKDLGIEDNTVGDVSSPTTAAAPRSPAVRDDTKQPAS